MRQRLAMREAHEYAASLAAKKDLMLKEIKTLEMRHHNPAVKQSIQSLSKIINELKV
jgi:hypothetical protein